MARVPNRLLWGLKSSPTAAWPDLRMLALVGRLSFVVFTTLQVGLHVQEYALLLRSRKHTERQNPAAEHKVEPAPRLPKIVAFEALWYTVAILIGYHTLGFERLCPSLANNLNAARWVLSFGVVHILGGLYLLTTLDVRVKLERCVRHVHTESSVSEIVMLVAGWQTSLQGTRHRNIVFVLVCLFDFVETLLLGQVLRQAWLGVSAPYFPLDYSS